MEIVFTRLQRVCQTCFSRIFLKPAQKNQVQKIIGIIFWQLRTRQVGKDEHFHHDNLRKVKCK